MSLPMNSDFEVVSNAEAAAVIDKYSPAMLQMTLQEILNIKANNHGTIPFANMVESYEMNYRSDIEKFDFLQQDIKERRIELYNLIMDMICQHHNLSWTLPGNADLYTLARTTYDFFISNFYNICIMFYSSWLNKESNELVKLLSQEDINSAHYYAKKRYTGKMINTGIIHTHLNKMLDLISGIDMSLYDIFNKVYINKDVVTLLTSSLSDNGDFYKNFYAPAVSGINRANAVTDIRFGLMPADNSEIMNYIL